MFCIRCGAENRDEAIYCQKCGRLLEAEEETRVAKKSVEEETRVAKKTFEESAPADNDVEERQIFTISPTLMFVKVGYVLAIFGAFLLVALLTFFEQLTGVGIPWWLSVLAGLSLLLIPAYFHFKHKVVRYTLTDSKIEIDEGFVFQNSRNVPLRSILDVSVSSTIPQRMLGFGNLIIENANETDKKIILKNINSPKKYADLLLKQMRRLDK